MHLVLPKIDSFDSRKKHPIGWGDHKSNISHTIHLKRKAEIKMESKAISTFENALSTAISLPGAKVDRNSFLASIFKKENECMLEDILEKGPIEVGYSQIELKKIAYNLVNSRTLRSTGMSFAVGLPGGAMMAATVPADIIQFFATALRLAQEVSYLYGADDLWDEDTLNDEKVTNQLVLYLGVMFGAGGSVAMLKVLASKISQQVAKKLPQKALTKTLLYPIIKQTANFIGVKMTKDVFAKGVAKAVPIVGGVISGGLTYASMKPMGRRLVNTLDEASYDYSEEDLWQDIEVIVDTVADEEIDDTQMEVETQNNWREKFKELMDNEIFQEKKLQTLKDRYISKFLRDKKGD